MAELYVLWRGSDEAEKLTGSMLHSDGTLLDDAKLKAEFPVWNLLGQYFGWGHAIKGWSAPELGNGMPQGLADLGKEDGVTAYSYQYWREFIRAASDHESSDPWLPINETLAEIARIHLTPNEGV
jgi:hypothetical protein